MWKVVVFLPAFFPLGSDLARPHSPLPSLTTSFPQCRKQPLSLVSIQMETMTDGKRTCLTFDRVVPCSGFSLYKNVHTHYGGSKLSTHTLEGGVLEAAWAAWAHLGSLIQGGQRAASFLAATGRPGHSAAPCACRFLHTS